MCSKKVRQVKFKEHVASSCALVIAEPLSEMSMHVRNPNVKKKVRSQYNFLICNTAFNFSINFLRTNHNSGWTLHVFALFPENQPHLVALEY